MAPHALSTLSAVLSAIPVSPRDVKVISAPVETGTEYSRYDNEYDNKYDNTAPISPKTVTVIAISIVVAIFCLIIVPGLIVMCHTCLSGRKDRARERARELAREQAARDEDTAELREFAAQPLIPHAADPSVAPSPPAPVFKVVRVEGHESPAEPARKSSDSNSIDSVDMYGYQRPVDQRLGDGEVTT